MNSNFASQVKNNSPQESSIKMENLIICENSEDIEQRILQFLERNGINMVNPSEKMQEYYQKRRNFTSFSNSSPESDITAMGIPKHKKTFNLSCPLYKRRK